MHRRARGFSLIELMVTVAIIAILLALAVPSFGSSVRASRERSVLQRMTQDFLWARGASGTADASTLNSTLSGPPTITLALAADCSWTTAINGTTDSKHSMTAAQVTAAAPGVACSGTGFALPATFTFTPQGFVDRTGTLAFAGTQTVNPIQVQILSSGAIFRTTNAS